ncbi:MAG: hypothetical protein AB7E47_05995 [Desulfovibrionaceae bacterium]
MMRSAGMGMLRAAIQELAAQGGTICAAAVCQAVGAKSTAERDRVYDRIREMMKSGELRREHKGVYTYNPDFQTETVRRAGKTYVRMWRAITVQKPGWTVAVIARVALCSEGQVRKFLAWLQEQGFIARHGQHLNAHLYRVTAEGRAQRDTPWPSFPMRDPFARERRAGVEIVRALMERDPGRTATAAKIRAACAALLERFGEPETTEAQE